MRSSRYQSAIAAAVAAVLSASAVVADEPPEEVIVTSTALRKNPLEVAQPTSVVTGDELRRIVATSIGETLSGELGVSSSYFGPSASRPVIRGLGGDRVQILDDGIASLDVSSLSQDHAVSLESVVSQQIEIIKGPAALLYGSGAAGGLVNVVTNRIPSERPERVISGAAEVRGDSAVDENTFAGSLEGGAGALAWHLDYFDRETDDVSIEGFAQTRALREQLIEAGEEPNDVSGHIENSASDTKGGAAGLSLVGEQAFGGTAFSRYETQYGIPGEEEAFIDMTQDRYDAKAEWRSSGAFIDTLRLRGSYNDYTHTEFEAPGEPGTVFVQDAYEARLAADHHFSDNWRGTAGLQYLDIDFEAIGDEAFVPQSVTRAVSVFAFEERKFSNWTLELGARAENQTIEPASDTGLPDFDETAVSLSVGSVFKVAQDQSFAVNVTRTQRNPQPVELYANGPHIAAQRFEVGDPGLTKETAVTADVSLRRQSSGVDWLVSAFYNDYTDYIFPRPTGEIEDDLPVFNYLQADARFYGFEAEITIPVLSGESGNLDLRLASDYVRGKLDSGADLPQIPPLRLGAGLHYDRDRWHAGVQAFYYDEQDKIASNELATESFTIADADVSYRVPMRSGDVFVFLRGTNLLDEEARQHASPLKDIAPLPGRSLHVGVRASF